MAKPRIGMVGYFGYGNYGDELFLQVFGKYLPDFEPVFLQDQLNRPFYTKPLEPKVAELDAILIGGGDLVIPDYWTDQYFEDAFLAKPIYMHGLGVPTWGGENAAIVARMAKFFQHPNVRRIHVRDAESRSWIESKLTPNVPVQLTPDIVCALDLPDVERPSKPPIFGLVTRRQKPGSIGWENVRRLCDRAKMLGYRIRHIILGTGPVGIEDIEGAKEFNYDGMEVVHGESIDDLTRAIGECTVLASMKFHGCVVAFMYGVPTIGLITTDKFRNFFKIAERPELLAHHRHTDLDKRLPFHMARIPNSTIRELRGAAEAGLLGLQTAMKRDLLGDA
jgi:polysaccharide pyruvyl transferase WcaK-like protein